VQAYLAALREKCDPEAVLVIAWERFVETYAPLILRLVQGHFRPESELEDCVQEVWQRLMAALATYRQDPERDRFRSWLGVIVRRTAADLRRRRRPTEPLTPAMVAGLVSRDEGPEAHCERGLVGERVQQALAALRPRVSPENFQILYRRGIEERPIGEIATALAMAPEHVRDRYYRMKQLLCALLGDATGNGSVPARVRKKIRKNPLPVRRRQASTRSLL
jgi:RNA polymerase sigma factor (sigma-70 family)